MVTLGQLVMDIWVNRNENNYKRVKMAFLLFGLPIMPLIDFMNTENDVFSYGKPPYGIDLMTKCKGLVFDESIKEANMVDVDGLKVNLISYQDLIKAKKASERYKDLNDLEHL